MSSSDFSIALDLDYPEQVDRHLESGGRLKAAIRAITVEASNDEPNGPTEAALGELLKELERLRPWRERDAELDKRLAALAGAGARLSAALADDAARLARAGADFFGEDFTAPEAP